MVLWVQLCHPNRRVLLDSRVHSIGVKNAICNPSNKKSTCSTTKVPYPFLYPDIPVEVEHLDTDHGGISDGNSTEHRDAKPVATSPFCPLINTNITTLNTSAMTKPPDTIFDLNQFSEYEQTFSLKCLQLEAKPPHFILFNDGLFIRLTTQKYFRFWPIELIWIEMDEKRSDSEFEIQTPEGVYKLVSSLWHAVLLKTVRYACSSRDDLFVIRSGTDDHNDDTIDCNSLREQRCCLYHLFRSGPLEGFAYYGSWLNGELFGSGKMCWPAKNFNTMYSRKNSTHSNEQCSSETPSHIFHLQNENNDTDDLSCKIPDSVRLFLAFIGPLDICVKNIENKVISIFCDGEFQSNQLDGLGELCIQTTQGSINVRAEWKNGRPHGIGSLRYMNGDIYTGWFVNGTREGHGCQETFPLDNLRYPKQCYRRNEWSTVYSGNWLADKQDGFGILKDTTNGDVYVGQWLKGVMCGRGILHQTSGIYVAGEFQANGINGQGLCVTPEGNIYTGLLAKNQPKGKEIVVGISVFRHFDHRCFFSSKIGVFIMSALFNFQSLLSVILLLICTCAYVRHFSPALLDSRKHGLLGLFWKCARIGERKSPYVAVCCIAMACAHAKKKSDNPQPISEALPVSDVSRESEIRISDSPPDILPLPDETTNPVVSSHANTEQQENNLKFVALQTGESEGDVVKPVMDSEFHDKVPETLVYIKPEDKMFPVHVPYIIVGAGAAGMSAARSIRASDPASRVLLIAGGSGSSRTAEPGIEETSFVEPPPYLRPPLSKELWGRVPSKEKKLLRSDGDIRRHSWLYYEPDSFFLKPEDLNSVQYGGVALLRGDPVVRLDPDSRRIFLASGLQITYDRCLLATGGSPRRLKDFETCSQTGANLADTGHVSYFRNMADYKRLRDIADKLRRTGGQIAVIGGGYLGSELSISLLKQPKSSDVNITPNSNDQVQSKLSVIHAFRETVPMGSVLPPCLAAAVARLESSKGVDVWSSSDVVSLSLMPNANPHDTVKGEHKFMPLGTVTANTNPERVHMRVRRNVSGVERVEEIDVDHVVCVIGIEPNTELSSEAALELDPNNGGFLVNAELEARQGVYVAGDAASYWDPVIGRRRRVEHLNFAEESGSLAGKNMAASLLSGSNPSAYNAVSHYQHQSSLWSTLGPELSWDAVGLIDSRLLLTRSFFAANSDDLNTSDDKSSAPRAFSGVPDSNIGRLAKGVVFYLTPREKRLVGILLWNMPDEMYTDKSYPAPGRLNLARSLLAERRIIGSENSLNDAEKEKQDLQELASQFDIYGEIAEEYAQLQEYIKKKSLDAANLGDDNSNHSSGFSENEVDRPLGNSVDSKPSND
ncbi:unnamed protein product [Heterobilharzia americana]|nr:unnamed protein product [Heterobilharzia americana]